MRSSKNWKHLFALFTLVNISYQPTDAIAEDFPEEFQGGWANLYESDHPNANSVCNSREGFEIKKDRLEFNTEGACLLEYKKRGNEDQKSYLMFMKCYEESDIPYFSTEQWDLHSTTYGDILTVIDLDRDYAVQLSQRCDFK